MTRPSAPDNDQTADQLAAYYRNVKSGDVAVMRCTQGHILEYKIDKISDTKPRLGRVYLEQGEGFGGRAYYAKTGKSCYQPTGQTNLVVPTEEVLAWINDHTGKLGSGVLSYDVDYNIVPPGQRNGRHGFTLTRTRQAVMDRAKKVGKDKG